MAKHFLTAASEICKDAIPKQLPAWSAPSEMPNERLAALEEKVKNDMTFVWTVVGFAFAWLAAITVRAGGIVSRSQRSISDSPKRILSQLTFLYPDGQKDEMNCYFVLDVPSNADAEGIRSAFRILARRYHPDAGSGSSPEKFREIVEAYETLSDPVRRQAHDDTLLSVQPRMMVEVEPMAARRSYTASPPMFVYGSRAPFTSDIHQLFDEIVRSFEEEFFFSPFVRGIS